MSEPSPSDVLARLERMEALLERIAAAVEGAPRAAAGATRVAAPPRAPAGADSAPGPQPAPPSGPLAGIQDLVTRMFDAVLRGSEEEAWGELEALTHTGELVAPRALDHLRAFSWRKLRRTVDRYLTDPSNPGSFRIVRTLPPELPADAVKAKLFLASSVGSPAPLSVARDDDAGGAWRLTQISL